MEIQLQIGVGVGFDEWDLNWCVGHIICQLVIDMVRCHW